jgi:hypothetical protein
MARLPAESVIAAEPSEMGLGAVTGRYPGSRRLS